MKRKYILFFIFCWASFLLSAQTLEQARAMFTKGQYAEAKPVFERYVKSQPSNANYNYWYGVCCLKTGDAVHAVKPLELAVKRKIQHAPLYLGEAYNEVYRFEEAIESLEDYIEAQKKRRQSAGEAEALLKKATFNLRLLKGVEQVMVIDSFVVDKADFLTAYKISEESGKLFTYNDYFQGEETQEGTVYQTELANKIYYSVKSEEGVQQIRTQNKLLDGWSQPVPLPESINNGSNVNYPFVLTDGITIYFASDGEGSMGGYDIFVTRFNSNTDNYLTPENVGMPFNSPYNDYMFVIDEFNNLGWFASDRYQPEDKVCIYVFVPNSYKKTYDYENMDEEELQRIARLVSIEDTWDDEEEVEEAKERLADALNTQPKEQKVYDFTFIINDEKTYHSWNDFTSQEALKRFRTYQLLEKDLREQENKLQQQREQYTHANKQQQLQLSGAILDLEKRVRQMTEQLWAQGMEVRNLEIKNIK
ncbi:MAG: tetratricopeptide repeat protein [Bacteroides sp.]|nr:tetratricopeptide repeat protein [Bacteroides sp.]